MNYPSQARKESMALAFAELDKVADPVICEVGRLRNVHAGESDGHSTLVFLEYVNGHGGKLISIDKDEATESVCRRLFMDRGISDISRLKFVNKNALEYPCRPDHDVIVERCDLLYLDGWDLPDPTSAKKHLICFLIADAAISSGGLVLIDDTGYPDLGKGKLVVPVAVLMGWTVLHQGFQTLLRKP
ncbi:MAG: hypothetical protein WC455_19465 [Dehalococcoidia bacterium]